MWNLRGKLEEAAINLHKIQESHNDIKKQYRRLEIKSMYLTDFVNPRFMKLPQRLYSKGMSKYGLLSSPKHDYQPFVFMPCGFLPLLYTYTLCSISYVLWLCPMLYNCLT
ncbi:uncharacterized protein RHIMIDRAFT_50238 [Rhizopus microsporus ATCC 52813]|uniref:Uncharacterized protein n=2 Tax=Rhizopus microsporus TaxID=58291 RepID=A0A2G4SKJ9_RHIZD|nr:uncharacterized protein RHIMIDRAFT_50238 [Rhizopus microsporus ATCC 52813]PHZ09289.1 hypothetical protein RHIMIDRAFT_50238 [Rhizopus microsporus ATCC 52813]